MRRAAEMGLRILGLDAFQLTERTTQPFMEHSIDTSNDPPELALRKVVALLEKHLDSDFYFEVVLDDGDSAENPASPM